MKKYITWLLMSAVLILPSLGFGQELTSPQKTPEGSVKVPDGTEFTAVSVDKLSSKSVAAVDPVTYKVGSDVVIDGQTVIAKDAVVKGTVVESKRSGSFGRSGKLDIRLDSVLAIDGQAIPVRASKGKSGASRVGTTAVLFVAFGPIGLLKHGKQGEIKKDTSVTVFIDEARTIKTR